MSSSPTATPRLAIDAAPALVWGFYDSSDWQRSNNGLGTYDSLNKSIGKPMSATCPQLSWSYGVNADGTPRYQRLWTPRLDADRAAGRVSLLTWMSFNLGHPEQTTAFNNEAVIAGRHDPYILQFAQDAAAYGHRFVVRFNPEMNGWWEGPFSEYDATGKLQNGNTDGSFVRMWRHVVDLVRPIAPNVVWYWCANPLSSSSTNPTYTGKLAHFYPGDNYVDAVGYDVYNKASDGGSPWLSFVECLEGRASGWPVNSVAPLLALAPGKPWILGEVGCAPATAGDTTPGAGDRAAWIANMLAAIPTRYPFIRALAWYNVAPYAIDAAAAVGWTQGTASPSYPGAPLLNPETWTYRVVATPDVDSQLASLQGQLQTAAASLASAQSSLATVNQQLTAAQSIDTSDQTQIATLNGQLQAATASASAADSHAQALAEAMREAQQHVAGLMSFAQAPLA